MRCRDARGGCRASRRRATADAVGQLGQQPAPAAAPSTSNADAALIATLRGMVVAYHQGGVQRRRAAQEAKRIAGVVLANQRAAYAKLLVQIAAMTQILWQKVPLLAWFAGVILCVCLGLRVIANTIGLWWWELGTHARTSQRPLCIILNHPV